LKILFARNVKRFLAPDLLTIAAINQNSELVEYLVDAAQALALRLNVKWDKLDYLMTAGNLLDIAVAGCEYDFMPNKKVIQYLKHLGQN
jgi:hypothetical protein